MTIIRGEVGEQFLSDGDASRFRMGRNGELIASKMHGRHYTSCFTRHVFSASPTGITNLTVMAAGASGILLFNPAGSEHIFEILQVRVAISSVPVGGCQLVLAGNLNVNQALPTASTAVTIRSAKTGIGSTGVAGSGSRALAFSSGTFAAAPVAIRVLGGVSVAALLVHTNHIVDDVNGAVCLAPGTAVSVQTITGAVNAIPSITWAEWPR